MAFQLQTLRLEIEGPGPSTVGWATETLLSLDYAYNLAAVIAYADHEYLLVGSVRTYSEILRGASDAGLYAANFAVSALLPADVRLQFDKLYSGSPLEISITGIAEAITALRDSVDPTERRHRKAMYEQQETAGELAGVMQEIEAYEELIQRALHMRRNLLDFMTTKEADELVQRYLDQASRAMAATNRNKIREISRQ